MVHPRPFLRKEVKKRSIIVLRNIKFFVLLFHLRAREITRIVDETKRVVQRMGSKWL